MLLVNDSETSFATMAVSLLLLAVVITASVALLKLGSKYANSFGDAVQTKNAQIEEYNYAKYTSGTSTGSVLCIEGK